MVISVSGTRAKNMERQPKASTSAPPPSVAAIMPSVDMADISPNALPRSSDGNMAVISAGADRDYQAVAYRLSYAQGKHEWE